MSEQDPDQKIKNAAGKAPFELLPWAHVLRTHQLIRCWGTPRARYSAFEGLAWVFEYGARKYAPRNYARAFPNDATIARYIGAARRHYLAHVCGDPFDVESGLPHLDQCHASLVMLDVILGAPPAQPDSALSVRELQGAGLAALCYPDGGARDLETVRAQLPVAIAQICAARITAFRDLSNKRGNNVPTTT